MTIYPPLVTGLIASALVFLQLLLMVMVGSQRFSLNQGLGDGGHAELQQAIRRHGNLAENAALFAITLGLLELLVGSTTLVMGLAGAFLLVRISHALGLTMGDGANVPRAIGAFGTLLTMGTTAIYLAYQILIVL